MQMFKVPLLCVWKVHILVLGVPNNRLTCMQGQKHFLSYNMHLFLSYLLNDSQTIRSTIHFSKPLCVTLICGDWSNWSHFHFIMPVMPDKAVLLCVQRYRETAILRSKAAPSAKNEFAFSFRPKRKDQVGRHQHEQLGTRFKNDSFQWFRVDSLRE